MEVGLPPATRRAPATTDEGCLDGGRPGQVFKLPPGGRLRKCTPVGVTARGKPALGRFSQPGVAGLNLALGWQGGSIPPAVRRFAAWRKVGPRGARGGWPVGGLGGEPVGVHRLPLWLLVGLLSAALGGSLWVSIGSPAGCWRVWLPRVTQGARGRAVRFPRSRPWGLWFFRRKFPRGPLGLPKGWAGCLHSGA